MPRVSEAERKRRSEFAKEMGKSNLGKKKPRKNFVFITTLLDIYPEYIEYEGELEKVSWDTLTQKGIRTIITKYPLDIDRLLKASHLHILHLEQYIHGIGKGRARVDSKLHEALRTVEDQKERAMKLHGQLLALQQEKEREKMFREEFVLPVLERIYVVIERRIPDPDLRRLICDDLSLTVNYEIKE